MAHYPEPIQRLIQLLKKLPGVGGRTAERFAFQLLSWKTEDLQRLADSLNALPDELHHCPACFCLKDAKECAFCNPRTRDLSRICVIGSAKDAYLIDETGTYRGLYHVLGALLSPLQGRTSAQLRLEPLIERIQALGITEVILALDSTLEGDTTSLFLKEQLGKLNINVSRLAFGIPMGSSLDFIDGSTLGRALTGRQHF